MKKINKYSRLVFFFALLLTVIYPLIHLTLFSENLRYFTTFEFIFGLITICSLVVYAITKKNKK